MKLMVRKEVEEIIKELNCHYSVSVDNFRDKVTIGFVDGDAYWAWISTHCKLSGGLVREFQDKLDWNNLSHHQNFSEEFLWEFRKKINWYWYYNPFREYSEDFIYHMFNYLSHSLFKKVFSAEMWEKTNRKSKRLVRRQYVDKKYRFDILDL